MAKFLILGLPRSRTYWFSRYLSRGEYLCTHEAAWNNKNYAKFLKYSTAIGDSTTMYPIIRGLLTDEKKVFIHRNLGEVIDSMNSIGLPMEGKVELFEYSDQLMKEADGLHIPFNEVNENLDVISDFIDLPFIGKKSMINIKLNNVSLIEELK